MKKIDIQEKLRKQKNEKLIFRKNSKKQKTKNNKNKFRKSDRSQNITK